MPIGGEVLRGGSVPEEGDAPIEKGVVEGGMLVGTSGAERCWACKSNLVPGSLLTLGGVPGADGSSAAGKNEEAD